MIVDHADGLHPGVDDDGADELEASLLESFEMVSESGVVAGTGPVFWIGLPPTRSQAKAAKLVPACCMSRKMRAP